ncbi:MAG: hypothetical protein MH137_04240 [Flavobacteriales bacterium]|nr:hypothetical protein [Flavobacteriales bacterium]
MKKEIIVLNPSNDGKLNEFKKLIQGLTANENVEEYFDKIAELLMNSICLEVGRSLYRIIEIEFYYNDKNGHNDPYVHNDDMQLSAGMWYFNGMGLDITIGGDNVFGGILIRGIRTIEEKPKYISGPSNVLKELFSKIGDVFSFEKMEGGLMGMALREVDSNDFKYEATKLFKSKRIGLTRKPEDVKGFIDFSYRYLVDVDRGHKFKDKTKVVLELFNQKKIDNPELINKIMGYKVIK